MAADGFITTIQGFAQFKTPDAAFADFTSDFRVRLDVAPVTWGSGGTRVLFSSLSGSFGWYFGLTASGIPSVRLGNGTATNDIHVSPAWGFGDGIRRQIEADVDLDDGAGNTVVTCRFRDPGDPGTDITDDTGWTSHGSLSEASIGLAAATAAITIGARSDASLLVFGKYYQAALWNGLGTTLVSRLDVRDPANQIGGDNGEWNDLVGAHDWSVIGTEGTHWTYTEPVGGPPPHFLFEPDLTYATM